MNPPVLFEDDDVIAVNKPEGIVSIAASGNGGLPDLLKSHYPAKLFVVHRLDREVSGVLLLAKNAAAHRHLNGEFARRAVQKTYLALAHGIFAADRGLIDRPIREFGSGRMGVDGEKGKPSSTEYEVAEKLQAFTLIRAFPLTGRRHQIRVHFYSLGHPVVGDRKYGDRSVQSRFSRLMLHACEISFRLPAGRNIRLEAPIPDSFSGILDVLRGRKA